MHDRQALPEQGPRARKAAFVFFIIAALFLGIGVMLLLATRQRRPKAAEEVLPPEAAEEVLPPEAAEETRRRKGPKRSRRPKGPRHKVPRRTRRGEVEPPRITKEEYLRQLAERSGQPSDYQPPSERQPL